MNDGGWKPVLKKRRMGLQTGRSRMNDLVSLFVDEVPEAMTPSDLFNLFSKFGVVKDVFIPLKRRKTTRSRFGFVRYDCTVAAEVAVSKADGLWCHNKALRVKLAEYSKYNQRRQMLTNAKQGGMAQNKQGIPIQPIMGIKGKSYAEVVQTGGKNGGEYGKQNISIRAVEAGNGWLYDSVLVKLKPFFSFHDFQKEIYKRTGKEVVVRQVGGRVAILSFSSNQQMKEERAKMEEWIHDWSDEVFEWEERKFLECDRCLWITCVGVPLNLWSIKTFEAIGKVWGEVVQYDADTVGGQHFMFGKVRIITKRMEPINTVITLVGSLRDYQVRVFEEPLVSFCQCNGGYSCQKNEVLESNMHNESEHLSKSRCQVDHVHAEVAVNGVKGVKGGDEGEVGSVAEKENDDDDVAQTDDMSHNGTHTADRALVAVDGGHHCMSGVADKVTERALGKERMVQAVCSRAVENGIKQRV
ncbi:unnamed protein product [Camellia sinensis]